jgi:class 3 adenylate cyclase
MAAASAPVCIRCGGQHFAWQRGVCFSLRRKSMSSDAVLETTRAKTPRRSSSMGWDPESLSQTVEVVGGESRCCLPTLILLRMWRKAKAPHGSTERRKSGLIDFTVMQYFPRSVARDLLDGRIGRSTLGRRDVSIFFSDVVNYTDLCSSLPALKVTSMMVRLHGGFDLIARKHGIDRIDVVGDAYIATCNLVSACDQGDPPHAVRMAHFALDAMRAARETRVDDEDPARGYVNLRIGLHIGYVVGSIVGTKYTVLGDAVNMASRMESTSLANRIQCTGTFAERVQWLDVDTILVCRRAGGADVHGKGLVDTWWLLNPSKHRLSCPNMPLHYVDRASTVIKASRLGNYDI